jgi:hypothetical protein
MCRRIRYCSKIVDEVDGLILRATIIRIGEKPAQGKGTGQQVFLVRLRYGSLLVAVKCGNIVTLAEGIDFILRRKCFKKLFR